MKDKQLSALIKIVFACAGMAMISMLIILLILSMFTDLDAASDLILGQYQGLIFIVLGVIWYPLVKRHL